jgi:sirohydrochlorin cobaltochelatase
MDPSGEGDPMVVPDSWRIPGLGSMRRGRRPDSALVLLGHGSTLNADSSRPVRDHAARMRQAGLFAEVATGFWKEQPVFCGCLRQVLSPRVFIVPMFISEGYFTEEVIPRELGMIDTSGRRVRHRRMGAQEFHYCRPVGTHASMTQLILERAREIVTRFPGPSGRPPEPGRTSLFIAGHGTGNNENSRKSVEVQVSEIRQLGIYAEVEAAFMEESPRIEDCVRNSRTDDLVVVPFFMSDGLHSQEDIPVLLGEAPDVVASRLRSGQPTWINPTLREGRRVWYTPGIGSDPRMLQVVLERVVEAEAEEGALS